MELNDRDRMLLAFANLASHGVAARPAMAGDAAGLAAELGGIPAASARTSSGTATTMRPLTPPARSPTH